MLEAVVVGAGQAGLAVGYHLASRGADHLLLDAGEGPGSSWRRRWDSLVLFTPAQYDALPGMPFPAERDTYPTKDAAADYLAAYAERVALPVRSGTRVAAVRRAREGFAVETAAGEILGARNVVVATGPFQVPSIPRVAAGLDPSVAQVHSDDYRNPTSLPGDGPVLVVGGGNSGCQIAEELARTRPVDLALGAKVPVLPQRPLGRDLWWWGERLRISRVSVESRVGRRLRERDPVIGAGPKRLARRHGVRLRPRVAEAEGRTARFDDGEAGEYDGVVWATGYTVDHSWVDVPEARGADGRLIHRRGVTSVEGLYLIGQSWQWRRGSALLGWVGEDARYLDDVMRVRP